MKYWKCCLTLPKHIVLDFFWQSVKLSTIFLQNYMNQVQMLVFCVAEIQLVWFKTYETYRASNVDFSLCFYRKDFCSTAFDVNPSSKTFLVAIMLIFMLLCTVFLFDTIFHYLLIYNILSFVYTHSFILWYVLHNVLYGNIPITSNWFP